MSFKFILFLVLIVKLTTKKCGEEDIGKIITDCKWSNQRQIIFFWKNECQKSSVELPSSSTSSDCNITCDQDHVLDWSIEDKILLCKKCPEGSQLDDSYEITEWNSQSLKNFVNNCYVVINDDVKTNESCQKFLIQDSILYAGGKNLNRDAMYSYELVFNEAFKKSGKITFTFRKDTIVKNQYINGQFNFYIDYDQKLHNVTESSRRDTITVSFPVNEGHHSFMWQYNVWADPANKEENEMAFQLVSLKLEGLRQRQPRCKALNETFKCDEDSVYNQENKTCVKCGEDEYVLDNQCTQKPFCNEDFIIEIHNGLCDQNNKDSIKYSYDEDKYCLEPNKTKRILSSEQTINKEPLASDDKPDFGNSKHDVVESGSATATIKKSSLISVSSLNSSSSNTSFSHDASSNITFEFHHNKTYSFLEAGILPQERKETCKVCPEGYFSQQIDKFSTCKSCDSYSFSFNNSCSACPKGTVPIRVETITGHTPNISSYFKENHCLTVKEGKFLVNKGCAAWVLRSHGINSGNRNIYQNKKILALKTILVDKYSELNSDSFIEIEFSLNSLLVKEYFSIQVNEEVFTWTDLNSNSDKEIKKKINLKAGSNEVKFIFSKNSETSLLEEDKPSVVIKKIKIEGSKIGGGIRCSDCDENSVKLIKDGSFLCKPCDIGFVPDTKKQNCIKCEENNSSPNCVVCPNFTEKNNQGCHLHSLIHNKKATMKFDFTDYKNSLNTECSTENEICYDNFFGPIKDPKTKDFFFISIFQRSAIEVTDFTYKTQEDFISFGHIFILTNSNSHRDSNHTENLKNLKNIGSVIKDVKIISSLPKERRRDLEQMNYANVFNQTGIMIEYGLGEQCTVGKKFRAFLFLYCDKSGSNHHIPRLVSKSQDGCTFFFEVRSTETCPLCVAGAVKPWHTACINEKRSIIFQENDNCRIQLQNENSDRHQIVNEISSILSLADIKKCLDLTYYFKLENKNYYEKETFDFSEKNLKIDDNALYVTNKGTVEEECSVIISNFATNEVYILLIIPLIWLITGFCLIVFYCKYRKARHDYNRLRQEIELSPSRGNDTTHDNSLQLEIN